MKMQYNKTFTTVYQTYLPHSDVDQQWPHLVCLNRDAQKVDVYVVTL